MANKQQDIRWKQRFEHYSAALARLHEAVDLASEPATSPATHQLLLEGMIQRFEFTQELAWKLLKDYEEFQGHTDIYGSRDAFRIGLEIGLIDDSRWMETLRDRNITSHTYEEETAMEVVSKIQITYIPLFDKLEHKMKSLV